MSSSQSCGNHQSNLNNSWSPSQVASSAMESITTLSIEEAEEFSRQFVITFVLFLHELILNIADEALGLYEEEEDEENKTEKSEMMQEQVLDADEEDVEDVFTQNPLFLDYIFDMFGNVANQVAQQYAPQLALLCGINYIGICDGLARNEDISSAVTYQLAPDFTDQCTEILAKVYENIVLQLNMDMRPSMIALEIWKRAAGIKTQTDIEDEQTVREYILQHSSDLMQLEIQTMKSLVGEKLEGNKAHIQAFVMQHGPSYVEKMVHRSLIPTLDRLGDSE